MITPARILAISLAVLATVASGNDSHAQPVTQHEIAILQQPVGDRQLGDAFGRSVAVHMNYLVVGAPGDDERGVDAGAAYVFVREGLTWRFALKLAPAVLRPGDAFGTAVDVFRGHIVVGAPGDDRRLNDAGLQLGIFENRGAAYLFERLQAGWAEPRRFEPRLSDVPYEFYGGSALPGPGDAFGSAVGITSSYVAFGAPLTDSTVPDVGAVYVSYSSGATWQQFVGATTATDTPGSIAPSPGRLGASLVLDFTTLNVGQPSLDWRPGGVRSYYWTGGPKNPFHWESSLSYPAPAGDVTTAAGLGTSVDWGFGGAPLATVPGDPSGPASGVVWYSVYQSPPAAIFPATGRDATMRFGTSVAGLRDAVVVGSVRDGHAGPAVPVMRFDRQGDGSWVQTASLAPASVAPGNDFGAAIDAEGGLIAVGSPTSTEAPGGYVALFLADGDADGLSDEWELALGLDPHTPVGVDGGAGDKDGDGVSNADEYAAQTHPTANPTFTRYFAEGATTWQFGTWLFLANPGTDTARVQLRFLRGDGTVRSHVVSVPGMSMQYVAVQDLPDMLDVEFATTIESDQLIVADRAMWWPRDPNVNPYGSHVERAIVAPAATWYFAEGATHSGFELFYLLQNPNSTDIDVIIRYLRPSAPPLEKLYRVPALSRRTVWVDMETFDTDNGPQALLGNTDVAAVIRGATAPAPDDIGYVHPPFIVERALYRQGPNDRPFEAGHESAGVTAPAAEWFFAEGATGDMFDTFILVANPSDTPAQVRATYLLDSGETFERTLTVAAHARTNIWADVESFDGGTTFPLADADFSTKLTSTNGVEVIAERSMWWPGPSFTTWHEAHNSFGSTETGTMWVAGYGASFFGSRTQTYVLIANPSDTTATVTVTPLTSSGPQTTQTYTIAAHSRFNVAFDLVGAPSTYFGVVVESTGSPGTPIVVERAVYAVAGALNWPVGSASLLTKIR